MTSTSADNWRRVKAHLEATGVMHNGDTTKARARGCKTCHSPVLTAFDADCPSPLYTVDPAPLTPLGEAIAVLQGRYTVGLWRAAGGYELHGRDHWHMKTPAGTGRCDVVAEHRCHTAPLPTGPSVHELPTRQETSTCPF